MAGSSSAYLRNSVQAKLERWITLERVVWFLAVVLFLVAWNRGLHLLYGLFSFLVSALVMSYLGAAWQLRRLAIQLLAPEEVFNGTASTIDFRVEGRGQLLSINLVDTHQVLERNDCALLDELNGVSEIDTEVVFSRRGSHTFTEVTVSSCFPFGLVTISRRIAIDPINITVFPKVSQIRQLPDQFLLGSQEDGELPQHRRQGDQEFAMVREYRQGDEMRHMHWRMSAKFSNWIVKEFDSTQMPYMALILNNSEEWVLATSNNPREHMIEIVASIAEKCAQSGCGLLIIFDDNHEYMVKPFQRDLHDLLYKLALWQGNESYCYSSENHSLTQFPLIMTFSGTESSSSESLLLSPYQHQIDIQFDLASYTGSGLKMGTEKIERGRRTQIKVSNTTNIWGLFS